MDAKATVVKKTPPLSVRLSPEERERLESSAKAADLTLSTYVRQLLTGEAETLDSLIAKRGRQRHLPNMETVAEITRARIALTRIADGLDQANAIGSKITLRALITQLEEIQISLTSIRRTRR